MATRRFKISVGEGPFDVTEEAGDAVNSDTVELTVECSTTAIDGRQVRREEVLLAIDKIKHKVLTTNWPPV